VGDEVDKETSKEDMIDRDGAEDEAWDEWRGELMRDTIFELR